MLSNKNIQMVAVLVVVVCHVACCLALPVARQTLQLRDPLLAMASDSYEATEPARPHEYSSSSSPSQYDDQPTISQEVLQKPATAGDSEQPNYRQEIYYVVDTEAAQQPGEPQQQYATPDSSRSEEPESPETNAGYPGEIVYVGQEPQPHSPQNEPNTVSGFMEMISGSASLPATILTEVPVNQLPEHVLEKLKRDYGVKVVATREKPGANLVINCEDYSGHDSGSICQRPSSSEEQASQQPNQSSTQEASDGPERAAQSYYYPQEDGSSGSAVEDPSSGQSSGEQANFGLRNGQK